MTAPLTGDEIIERVTEARYRTARTKDLVLAMLDAIREPSEEMVRIGDLAQTEDTGPEMGHQVAMASSVPWRAMIDALREEIAG